MINFTS